MVLSFKKEFKNKILKGTKIHTIREDKPNRWKRGNKIHFATGVRTKNYNEFKFLMCISTQRVDLSCNFSIGSRVHINVEGKLLNIVDRLKFAQNDGFETYEDFEGWFMPLIAETGKNIFTAKIIHWTNKRY
jgi:hypothetical protein